MSFLNSFLCIKFTHGVTKGILIKPSDVIVKDGVEYFTKPVVEQRTKGKNI